MEKKKHMGLRSSVLFLIVPAGIWWKDLSLYSLSWETISPPPTDTWGNASETYILPYDFRAWAYLKILLLDIELNQFISLGRSEMW